jgi:hypothetical protein
MPKNTMLLHCCWLQKAWRNTCCLSCDNGLPASTWWSTVSRHTAKHIMGPLEYKILKQHLKPGLLHYVIFILVLETVVTKALWDSFEIARIHSAVCITTLFQSKVRKQTCYMFDITKKMFKNQNNCNQPLRLIQYHLYHRYLYLPHFEVKLSVCYFAIRRLVTWTQDFKVICECITVTARHHHCYSQTSSLLQPDIVTVMAKHCHCYSQTSSLLQPDIVTVTARHRHCYSQTSS